MSALPPICIAYHSQRGHVRRLAEAMAEGAGPGAARLIDIAAPNGAERAALARAPLIAFGAPTHWGSTSAAFDAFLDEMAEGWPDHPWSGRLAAGFTAGASPSGDKWGTLTRMWVFAMQMGMIWVGQSETGAPSRPGSTLNPDGGWTGLMATSDRDKTQLIGARDLDTARRFGARLAWAAARWQAGAAGAAGVSSSDGSPGATG